MVEERKRGNVRTITVAARKRLIKWHLAQWASAPRSWWGRERMGFDSREKDGREDVRTALERLQGCKGNQLGGIRNTGHFVYRTRKGEDSVLQRMGQKSVSPCEYGEREEGKMEGCWH